MTDKPPAIAESIKEQAGYWIIRQNSGQWSGRDEQAFRHWLRESPEHAQAFAQVQGLWRGLDQYKTTAAPPLAKTQHKPAPQRFRWIMGGLCTIGILWGMLKLNPDPSHLIPSETTYTTRKGQQSTFALADGSEIALNTDTELNVLYSPLSRRVVLKHGEAAFKVAHETLRGFAVNAANGEIIDIGTQFNVQQMDGQVVVTVTEGAVRVTTRQQHSTPLLAGQGLSYGTDGILSLPDKPDLGAVTAWRQGHIVFDMTSLEVAGAQLARYHAVKFVFDDPKLKRLKISGTFNSKDLSAFLKTLESIYPLRAQIGRDQTVHLTSSARR